MKGDKGLLSGKIPGSCGTWGLECPGGTHTEKRPRQLHPHRGPLGEDAGGAWCRAGRVAESSRPSDPG